MRSKKLVSGCVLDSGVNFSDHLAVVIDANLDISTGNMECNDDTESTYKHYKLRLDKADLVGYYNETYTCLICVDTSCFNSGQFTTDDIDDLCNQIVQCLNGSAHGSVPVTASNTYKH